MGDKGDKKIHLDFRFDFAGSHPVDFTDNEAKRMRKRKLINECRGPGIYNP